MVRIESIGEKSFVDGIAELDKTLLLGIAHFCEML